MPDALTTTGWPGLDRVLRGLEPGDNVVWGVENMAEYLRFVVPYEKAARASGRPVIYFRFATHPPLFGTEAGIETHEFDPLEGFERFVRRIHEVIESHGPGPAYIFDSISSLADLWFSDQALGNFFMLTCPRLRDLQTITYFAIERDRHSIHAIEPIRQTTQFFLDVFSLESRLYIRPVKVPYRKAEAMSTLHVEKDGEFQPVEESAPLAQILSTTRWPRLLRNRRAGYWDGMYREIDRFFEARAEGTPIRENGDDLLRRIRRAFRIHRSGIAPLAEKWLSLEDFQAIRQRMIGIGSIGGKALGMLVARSILRTKDPDLSSRLEVHDSFFVGAEVFVTFLVRNGVWWIREKIKQGASEADVEEGRRRILHGVFPDDLLLQFQGMLDYFGERPCIVRSSSILEDARGNAFSGKYESIFLANTGSLEERLVALLDAIRHVYASVLDPEALDYRRSRGLLDSEERMALLIMRVSGRRRGPFFFPQAAGVGLSYNPWCWHPEIDPEAGMVRLVFGLGTRAVDRSDDDYTRLVSLSSPLRRPEASLDEQHDHSQHRMDVIGFADGRLVSKPVGELLPLCRDFPVRAFVDTAPDSMPWVTFENLLKKTNIVADLRRMMEVLAAEYGSPVDIEFAINFQDNGDYTIHLLQCRTFQVRKHGATMEEGSDSPQPGRRVLEAHGAVIGLGRRIPIHDLLFVPAEVYAFLPEQDRYSVARWIEELVSRHDPSRNLLLVGPGRWGTSSPSLGLPVRAGRIASACAICEVVAMHSGLVPDVSLGTHFFNDLVEHDLLYLACFPGKPGNFLDEAWLSSLPVAPCQSISPTSAIASAVRWISPPKETLQLMADPVTQSARLTLSPS